MVEQVTLLPRLSRYTLRHQAPVGGGDDDASLDHRSYLGVQLFLRRQRQQQAEPDPDPEGRLQDLHWCRCSCCRLMPVPWESLCCRELSPMEVPSGSHQCITQYSQFEKRVLDRDWLVALLQFSTDLTNAEFLEHERRHLRMAAYRSFLVQTHGPQDKGQRLPIPSCVISAIREKFPDPNMEYTDITALLDIMDDLLDKCSFQLELSSDT
ncbi:uncharacterized protein [Engystomops pustulosus]|uniref:uncharacterized protein isoform X2 n=1 Tax=Engystomops pustulosus TaxID=76066 RepID=UPI003AFB70AB